MRLSRFEQPTSVRLARGVLAVALAFGAAAASAQGLYRHVDNVGRVSFSDRAEAPIVQRELEPLPGQAEPASAIRGRSAKLTARAKATERSEAHRRLLQARRELARGPDMQQGIPPLAEKVPGDRRRARVITLQRNVEAARLRVTQVDGPDQDSGV